MALAPEPGVRVGLGFVGVVSALLPTEVDEAVVVLVVALLGPEALEGAPGLEEGSVDREVLSGQQVLRVGMLDYGGEAPG